MENKEKNKMIFDDASIEKLMQGIDREAIKKWLAKKSKSPEKTLSFGNANLSKIKKIVDIELCYNKNKFDNWFNYKYKLSENENNFLEYLIKRNRLHLTLYNEITLTTKFIAPVLNKINFENKHVKDWYGYKMESKLNNYILSGEPDFIVATGIEVPETPYFFLQEYKKSINFAGDPEYQVLAAMLAAMTLNNKNEIKGGYIIGQYWKFVILEKRENGNFEYFVHEGLNCLKLNELKQIYINLQAVKFLYCE